MHLQPSEVKYWWHATETVAQEEFLGFSKSGVMLMDTRKDSWRRKAKQTVAIDTSDL